MAFVIFLVKLNVFFTQADFLGFLLGFFNNQHSIAKAWTNPSPWSIDFLPTFVGTILTQYQTLDTVKLHTDWVTEFKINIIRHVIKGNIGMEKNKDGCFLKYSQVRS